MVDWQLLAKESKLKVGYPTVGSSCRSRVGPLDLEEMHDLVATASRGLTCIHFVCSALRCLACRYRLSTTALCGAYTSCQVYCVDDGCCHSAAPTLSELVDDALLKCAVVVYGCTGVVHTHLSTAGTACVDCGTSGVIAADVEQQANMFKKNNTVAQRCTRCACRVLSFSGSVGGKALSNSYDA